MEKAISTIFALGLGVISSSGLASGGDEQIHDRPPIVLASRIAEPVQLSADASVTTEGRVIITGMTNLPDQTKLLISLVNDAIGFTAQDTSRVLKGTFSTEALGPIAGVSPGSYVIEIIMPIPSTQPDNVQAVIGKEGEYLYGSLVSDSSWGGKIVEYSRPYTVGSKQSIRQAESAHHEFVDSIRLAIGDLLKTGHLMEQYRNTDDLSALKTCGDMMRKNQAEAKLVRTKAETLPMKYLNLKVASIEIHTCVSCSRTSLESCRRVDDSLIEAE